jgi:hypothetical protein
MSIKIFNKIIRIFHEIGCLLHALLTGMDIANKAIKRLYKQADGLKKEICCIYPDGFSESSVSLPII